MAVSLRISAMLTNVRECYKKLPHYVSEMQVFCAILQLLQCQNLLFYFFKYNQQRPGEINLQIAETLPYDHD